jgi:hypothetical protein
VYSVAAFTELAVVFAILSGAVTIFFSISHTFKHPETIFRTTPRFKWEKIFALSFLGLCALAFLVDAVSHSFWAGGS